MVYKLIENNFKDIHTIFVLSARSKEQCNKFIEIHNLKNISCKNLITINMDEYLSKENSLEYGGNV